MTYDIDNTSCLYLEWKTWINGFLSCPLCGSLVPDDGQQLHIDWHEELYDRIIEEYED